MRRKWKYMRKMLDNQYNSAKCEEQIAMAKQINQGGNQMKRKKLMALFMTTAVAASMLTGCGGGGSPTT